MKEKLTKESLQAWFDTVERINGARPDALAVWAKIEADREAIRAETREELLRDHFKIGEAISYDSATDGSERNGHVRIIDDMSEDGGDEYFVQWKHNARRPPKKRAKTDEEMLNNVIYRLETWEAVARGLARLGSLAAVCRDLGIDTEVDE